MSQGTATAPALPEGFICHCGEFHRFNGYVYAHWDILLVHKCEKCGRTHNVQRGMTWTPSNHRTKTK